MTESAYRAKGWEPAQANSIQSGLAFRRRDREDCRSSRTRAGVSHTPVSTSIIDWKISIDVVAPDAVAKMKHWMGKGLTGLRIFTSGSTHAEQEAFFADEAAFPAWQYASDQGVSVCMQMRVAGLPLLETVLKRFPKVRVILDHFARAEAADGPPFASAAPLFALARYPNVYLKLTHRPIEQSEKGKSTPEAFLGKAVKEFGAERIAWGSNFPAAKPPLPELIAMARKALSFLPQGDQDQIFYKTALALYPALAK